MSRPDTTRDTAPETHQVELAPDHVDALRRADRSLDEEIQRAIRLYLMLENADELLAEVELDGGHK